jgi:hypothetical protein
MKKNLFIALAMVVGIIFIPAVTLAEIFHLPSQVILSGDANGKIIFVSEDPTALDLIDGVVQFCNDTMKQRGWGMINNAFRPAERVNPNTLVIQLFEGTLKTQFSFNIKHGELWGLIPSCMLVPDGKTVIVENSAPSLNNNGGHHFSLIAHLTDPAYYKVAANIMPCPNGMSASNVSAQPIVVSPASAVVAPVAKSEIKEQNISPAPAKPVVVPVAKASPLVVKKPAVAAKKCDPCIAEAVAPVKAETEAIKASVGEATDAEKLTGIGDLHQKATRQIKVAEETQRAIAPIKADTEAIKASVGEATKSGVTLFDILEDVQKKVAPAKEKSLLEKMEDFWWLWLILIAGIGYCLYRLRRQPPPAPEEAVAQPEAGANNP